MGDRSVTPCLLYACALFVGTAALAESPHKSLSGAAVLCEFAPERLADGTFLDVRIVRCGTDAKYPLVRVEEVRRAGKRGPHTVRQTTMVADHAIVRARPGVSAHDLEAMARRLGVRVRRKLHAPGFYLVQSAGSGQDTVKRLVALLADEKHLVAYAEPDYLAHLQRTDPNDWLWDPFWMWGMEAIQAPCAWDVSIGTPQVVVGVIDTGIEYDHWDLADNIWNNPGETGTDGGGADRRTNGIDDDGNGLVDDWMGWDFASGDNDPMDVNGHGTHVAGTIGAVGNNSEGVVGVCWQVSLVPIRTAGTWTSDLLDAVYYATTVGCHVVSCSWGSYSYSESLRDAFTDADANGLLGVCAAGNDGLNGCLYPAAYALPNIISVAATSYDDSLASFSNWHASKVDLGAPGVDILSTYRWDYLELSGTSMATPHVAGVCALMKAARFGMGHHAIKQRLLASVDSVPALAGKVVTGGRLNASNAVSSVLGPPPSPAFRLLIR